MKSSFILVPSFLVVTGCSEVYTAETPSAVKPVPSSTAKISPSKAKPMPDKIVRSEEEWRKLLTSQQYRVLRQKGTERPFVNKYDDHFAPGTYACAACGQELFSSETKFHSGCGWPAFYAAKAGDRVVLNPDFSLGMVRTEVTCARCGSHLGHIFDDAPSTPTGQRYCINSVSLKFIPAASPKKTKPQRPGDSEEPSPSAATGESPGSPKATAPESSAAPE
jgi:peptide-methionine (R)-S-oxide reductase